MKLLPLMLVLLVSALPVSAEELAISRFAAEGIKGWEVKRV